MAKAPRGWSVRSRLLIIALLPMLILMPLLIGITMQRWLWRTDQILAARVASDLTVAQQYLAHLIDSTGRQVAAFGQSAEFAIMPPMTSAIFWPQTVANSGWIICCCWTPRADL